jgi:subtilisin family serine protease
MTQKKIPSIYFVFLFLAFTLIVLFWLILFGSILINKQFNSSAGSQIYSGKIIHNPNNWNKSYLPVNPGKIMPIDTTMLIIDTVGGRQIISNLVNIALQSDSISIADLAFDLKARYPSNDYQIVYIDSVVNRLQVQLNQSDRVSFKNDIKGKLSAYKLLVWDEVLFNHSDIYNDPELANTTTNWYLRAININNAWVQTTGNENIVIAVIDNGFDLSHPELKGKAVKPYNVINQSSDVSSNSKNHGTHVSSTIVANGNNGEGLVGICPNCYFMPIKVADNNEMISNSYVIDGILYAIKNGASVINLSLGIQIPRGLNIPLNDQLLYIKDGAKDEEEFWSELFAYAEEKRVTCVIAAGNNNMMTGFDPFQRPTGPIKVGAYNTNKERASFSNYGNYVTLYAPGTQVFGAKSGGGYEFLEGTSMAAPIVSGLVGLIKSKNSKIDNAELLNKLKSNTVLRQNIPILEISANNTL